MAKRLNELSGRAQFLVFVVLSAVAVAGAWQVLLGPARASLADRESRLSVLQGEIGRARLTAARLPAAERDVKAMERALIQTTAILPDEKDPQDVLRNLHELASETALSISSFTPKAIVSKTQYSEWPIEIGIDGGYHNLGRFLDRVATMARLMSVTDIKIKTNAKAGKHTITASCTATTFVFQKDAISPESTPLVARASVQGGMQ
jgi:Tfp pilus assembly protein PilO